MQTLVFQLTLDMSTADIAEAFYVTCGRKCLIATLPAAIGNINGV